ncbi:MAG: substrate-binding domain-containing protein [Flavobacteriaceae bacterium]|nr:substrate-binding domain-containing protein [Flavobacteriaceae bacterium]
MKIKYTIKDIAKLAGVSKGTVDRVLHKRGKISKEALDKVNLILEEIDYQPNLMARSLKSNKIFSISVLIPNPSMDPYWDPCLEGVLDAKKEYIPFNISIETFYFNPESTASFLEANEFILSKNPDAVLLVPLFFKETLTVVQKYKASKIPVATFNNQLHSDSISSFVGQDLIQSGRVAAKLLDAVLKKGNIAVIHINEVFKNAIHMQEKEKGFRDYFKELKDSNYKIITCKLNHPNFEKILTDFMQEHPSISGVFVTTSKAYQVAALIEKIYKNKITIIGYDLLDKNIKYLNEGVIDFLINQNQKRQAYLGTTNLIEHFIFGKEISRKILLPIDIINSENAKYYTS